MDSQAPWTLYKEGKTERLAAVIRVLLENMYKIAVLLYPVMPESSQKMQAQLGKEFSLHAGLIDDLLSCKVHLRTGVSIAEASNLFPRLEKSAEKPAEQNEKKQNSNKNSKQKDVKTKEENTDTAFIEFADFQKLDLRVGTILAAEQHPDADKLLRFEVDLGEEKPRQIISGIAEFYKPADLVGHKVVVVANLPPRKLRGLVSHGMILTAEKGEHLSLLTSSAPNGAKIS